MKTFIAALSFMVVLIGCGSDYTSDTNRDGTVDTTTPTTNTDTGTETVINETLAFSDVHTALNTKCLACHGTGGGFTLGSTGSPLPEAEAYNNVLVFVTGASSAASTRLLQKATGIGHGGGVVLTASSYEYIIISEWINAGTSLDISFDVNTTGVVIETNTTNPGYDLPTAEAMSFTKNHKGGFGPVQGQACIQCHNSEEGQNIVGFGGTLFSYIHTPNAKYYQDLSSYKVTITRESGSSITATTRAAGSEIGHNNFSSTTNIGTNINFTAYIKDSNGDVVNQSGTNTHNSSTHADCNSCHTKDGTNSAPGRVLVPLVN